MRLHMAVLAFFLVLTLATPVSATQLIAPDVPASGAEQMPEGYRSFGEGLETLVRNVIFSLQPHLREALQVSLSLTAAVMMVSFLAACSGEVSSLAGLCGTVATAAILLQNTNAMVTLGAETVRELSEYGKLLFPVLTAAVAAQGGALTSAALYTGTAAFDAVLTSMIANLLVPLVYVFLALAIANSALGEELLKKLRDLVKTFLSWVLKIVLTVFTTYISITGVVSGTTDTAALKATKVTISSFVPVVGSILSDASEAVLVGAGVAKNAAGIYGILAILAVCLAPFARIGIHYLVLKATGAVCAVFGPKGMTGLIDDFSTAMGLLLAMTGSACLLLLISAVCFLKGAG